jgi:zona occludens toxin (predicted ATPase)
LSLDDSLALARIVKAESAPNDAILIFGWEFQVGFLAERRSATRFVNIPATRLIRPGQPLFGEWLTEFDRELTEHPPKFILVDRTVTGTDAMAAIVRRRLSGGYAVREQRGSITLLERVG